MHIEIEYQGKIYKGKQAEKNANLETVVETFYEKFDNFSKMKFHLEDGSIVIFGKEVLQNCVMRFVDTPNEKTYQNVRLISNFAVEKNKLAAIKCLREFCFYVETSLTLKEAKYIIDNLVL